MLKKNIKTILIAITLAIVLILPNISTAEHRNANKEPIEQLGFYELVDKYSSKYNVSKSEMLRVLTCENNTHDTNRQAELAYTFSDPKRGIVYGEREKSYGVAMIHLPDHLDISYKQATNMEFSINYMALEFSKGRASQWSCYKL